MCTYYYLSYITDVHACMFVPTSKTPVSSLTLIQGKPHIDARFCQSKTVSSWDIHWNTRHRVDNGNSGVTLLNTLETFGNLQKKNKLLHNSLCWFRFLMSSTAACFCFRRSDSVAFQIIPFCFVGYGGVCFSVTGGYTVGVSGYAPKGTVFAICWVNLLQG